MMVTQTNEHGTKAWDLEEAAQPAVGAQASPITAPWLVETALLAAGGVGV